ncbi:MAG: ABC-type transport auxiliary lipoprotein family protein [Sulfurospirillaceae bacterium]|nr:ABC-type transport auxiliary lipoprotein family protein [Sulfurospirillaceae bacterium]MDD2825407.1 ABC-type transport auxiliary lipoprotein family protein [Sulfurospirillaceae bacterium]
MKHTLTLCASLLLMAFISGCSTKDVQLKPFTYTLDPILKLERFGHHNDDVLKVSRVESYSGLNSRAILYLKDGAMQPYKYGVWSETPSLKLQHLITENLQDQNHFNAVVLGNSLASSNLVLESILQNFEEVFVEDTSYVYVSIRFRVIDMRTSDVIASVKLSSKKDVVNLNGAAGSVEAFNAATAEVIKNLSFWINNVRP